MAQEGLQCIEVLFLPVCNTQEDIDPAFSRTTERLRGSDARTLSDLHFELKMFYRNDR